MIQKIGVLTSGGDAPGMNAAVRAVVRTALSKNLEVYGIYDGYLGLHQGRIEKLERHDVSDMINRGGTFLGSARFPEFKDEKVRAEAIENLREHGIEALASPLGAVGLLPVVIQNVLSDFIDAVWVEQGSLILSSGQFLLVLLTLDRPELRTHIVVIHLEL